MNKNWQNGFRLLIATGSVMGFMGGWVLLAHAPKPVAADSAAQSQIAPVIQQQPADLSPLPSLQPLSPQQFQQPVTRFRMRSGGS
ncbi:MAG: hypothetical protein ACM3JD_16540 [Rudaea sp.]